MNTKSIFVEIGSASTEPVTLGFLLIPQFSLMSFAAAIEPLRAANRLSGRTLYRWQLISIDGQPVDASNGVPLSVQASLDQLSKPDMLVVCAGLRPLQYQGDSHLRRELRRIARHGCRVGAISGGSFILADAGLLADQRCTVHWEYNELFKSQYPQLKLIEELYVVEREVFTCSGGTAALDLMLHFVGENFGSALALAVAEQFIHPRIREHGDQQRMDVHTRYGLYHAKLGHVIRLMEKSIEHPLTVQTIARRVGLSGRQIERLFHQHLGATPGEFYLQLRIEQGRRLLLQTSKSILQVALECGFRSASHFCHAYRRLLGRTPTEERSSALSRRAVPQIASCRTEAAISR